MAFFISSERVRLGRRYKGGRPVFIGFCQASPRSKHNQAEIGSTGTVPGPVVAQCSVRGEKH